MIVQTLGQSMLYSLGLRGGFEKLAYPRFGFAGESQFDPKHVMRRFLLGETGVHIPGLHPAHRVDFEPYTVDKMIDLLQAARAHSMRRKRTGQYEHYVGSPASRLSNELITKELVNPADYSPIDPVLGPKLYEFEVDNGAATGNEYFEPALNPSHPNDYRLTREFWLCMLRKYNYIIP